jgi:hypothetical protein
MAENPSDLQGNDWFSRLKNPQGSAYDTATAEGLSSKKPEPQEQNVDLPE